MSATPGDGQISAANPASSAAGAGNPAAYKPGKGTYTIFGLIGLAILVMIVHLATTPAIVGSWELVSDTLPNSISGPGTTIFPSTQDTTTIWTFSSDGTVDESSSTGTDGQTTSGDNKGTWSAPDSSHITISMPSILGSSDNTTFQYSVTGNTLTLTTEDANPETVTFTKH